MKHLAIKVTNKYESEAVQRVLFDMWFEWREDRKDKGKKVINPDDLIYYITPKINYDHENMVLQYTCVKDDRFSQYISSSEFFEKYAGHLDLFPDYKKQEEARPQFTEKEIKLDDLNIKVESIAREMMFYCQRIQKLEEQIKYLIDNQ